MGSACQRDSARGGDGLALQFGPWPSGPRRRGEEAERAREKRKRPGFGPARARFRQSERVRVLPFSFYFFPNF